MGRHIAMNQRSARADDATLAKPNRFRTHRPDFCGPQQPQPDHGRLLIDVGEIDVGEPLVRFA